MEAMKAIGNAGEGILISHMPTVDGSGRDGIVPGILKKEWFEELKERLPAANSAVCKNGGFRTYPVLQIPRQLQPGTRISQ